MTPDDEIQVESLDYLRHLATLADEPDEDPACLCCAWAVGDIISLRKLAAQALCLLRQAHFCSGSAGLSPSGVTDSSGTLDEGRGAADQALSEMETLARILNVPERGCLYSYEVLFGDVQVQEAPSDDQ